METVTDAARMLLGVVGEACWAAVVVLVTLEKVLRGLADATRGWVWFLTVTGWMLTPRRRGS